MLTVGEPAPLFDAPSTQGPIRLQDYIGKQIIVLIFYPADQTPGCTKQLCAARDARDDYEALGAVVISVNYASMESHEAFARKHHLGIPIVVDYGGRIRDAYKVGKLFGLFSQQRTVFVVDLAGRIAYARKGLPSTEELLDTIRRLQ